MDLTPLIFVALFVGWAIYLIPKFMRDHEELSTTRSLQDFSARLRVFAAVRTVAKMNLLGPDEPTVEISMEEVSAALREEPAAKNKKRRSRRSKAVSRPLPTLAAAKRAAKRRRRVLSGLLLVTAVVSVLAVAGVGPLWTPAAPVALVLLFMMSARRSVKRLSAARRTAGARPMASSSREEPKPTSWDSLEDEAISHAVVVEKVAVVETIETPADRLWDPVPMTLPTYLDKPTARRTVMSIELNEGVVSSGHDADDSELVRAAEAAALADDTPVDLEAPRAAGA